MIDLAEAGQRLANWEAGEPTDLAALYGRAERRTRRRRIGWGAAALVAVTALVLGAVLPLQPPPPSARVSRAAAGPFPPTPFPAAPKGWGWFLAGPVALASPGGGGGAPNGPIELCAPIPPGSRQSCVVGVSERPTAMDPVFVTQLRGKPTGRVRTIHGLEVYVSGNGQRRAFAVPALGVELETYGALGQRIATTLVPSPLMVVASATATPAVPPGWRTVHTGDLTLSVPPGWPVVHLRHLPQLPASSPGLCNLFPRAELYLGAPSGSCDGTGTSANGLWVGRSVDMTSSPVTTTRLRWVHGADVELLWSRNSISGIAWLSVQTPHGAVRGTIVLVTDPATLEAVLASIRVTG